MRMAVIGIALITLTGCGSDAPQPAATDKSLGSVVEEVARPADPMGAGSEAPVPEATSGGAAVQ